MDDNPYESPDAEAPAPVVSGHGGSRRVRLSVFFANCFLLLLFPPTRCPCWAGPIGFMIQPYLLVLGLPTILVAYLVPDVIESHRGAFFTAYIVNYVAVSYLIGEMVGRCVRRARRHERT